ncbi:MAG: ParB/RepB/Spo0J family partition protein [Bacilli bacterium]|nr:ParB/RepB/Spo0J family partition protein [Bacilli bacterium]
METSGRKVVELNIDDVLPNRFQPRIKFNEEAINELSKSIQEHGVIQPIVVRPIGDKFEIIAGERRYKASCMANLKTIPAIITDLNDKDSAEVALIENVQRENLTPIEEAISYKKILDMGYITQDALATKLGKTQSTVANKLRLLNLDDEVQEALLKEKISERHARSLLKLTEKEQQRNMLKRIIEERLPVRRTDEEIDKILNGTDERANYNKIENIQKENPIQSTIEETTPNQPTFKFFNVSNNQTELSNEQIEEPIKEEKTIQPEEEIKPGKFFNILQEEEHPEDIPQKFDFNSLFINPISNTNNNNRLINEIEEIENSINNSSNIKPIEKQQSSQEENIEINDDFDDFEEELEFVEEEKEKQETPTIEEQKEEIKSEKITINEPKINTFKDVLQSIRNCSNKIENAGFVIDTEEYDLEGMYQVVFKITKQ